MNTAVTFPFSIPSLSCDYNALEPYISKETMMIHHDKHHHTYVTNLNNALKEYPDLHHVDLRELLGNLDTIVPEKIRAAVRNNGGGHINHSLFWTSMTTDKEDTFSVSSNSELSTAIVKAFGSLNDFKTKFEEAGTTLFGSGWVYLVKDAGSNSLSIEKYTNQDNQYMQQGKHPIFGNDVWEHAYYLTYQNRRLDYLKNWWNVLSWKNANNIF